VGGRPTTACGTEAQCGPAVEVTCAGERRKWEGHGWAGLGRMAEGSGLVARKGSAGHKEDAGRNVNGL
jgi:hypothetical protein